MIIKDLVYNMKYYVGNYLVMKSVKVFHIRKINAICLQGQYCSLVLLLECIQFQYEIIQLDLERMTIHMRSFHSQYPTLHNHREQD